MPSEYTCTVIPPMFPLRHAKSHYSMKASTPTSSPSKARSRAGTPILGRPSSAAGEEGKTFTFDHCLWSVDSNEENYAGQERLYEVLGDEFLKHSLEGYNCCIFACFVPSLSKLMKMVKPDLGRLILWYSASPQTLLTHIDGQPFRPRTHPTYHSKLV
jgi:hypothetical protein